MSRRKPTLIICFLFLPLLASAWDARLASLNNPTLSANASVPSGTLPSLVFPTDEYGYGLSFIPDPLDIWKLPQKLADPSLFPSHSVIVDWSGPTIFDGSAGIVVGLEALPLSLAFFLGRPNLNGWVVGDYMDDLYGGNYWDEAMSVAGMNNITEPVTPANLADLIVALHLREVLFGVSVGFSYNLAADNQWVYKIETEKSRTSVITLRGGITVPLNLSFPLTIDLGSMFLISDFLAKYVDSAGTDDDSIEVDNFTYSVCGRFTFGLGPALDLDFVGEYAQTGYDDFSVFNDGIALTRYDLRLDGARIYSGGGGIGINWTPNDSVFVNGMISVISGGVDYNDEPAGVFTSEHDNITWITFRSVIDSELAIRKWFYLRGGIGTTVNYVGETHPNPPGPETRLWYTVNTPSASAGIGFIIAEKIHLDIALNLMNIIGYDTVNPYPTLSKAPALQASIKADL
jgi:hypothetical protein